MKKKLKLYKKQILLLILIIVPIIVIIIGKPYSEYKKAVQLFDENKFKEATTIFEELGNYKNSIKYLEKINTKIYKKAYKQYRNGEFTNAEKLFCQIADYKDTEKYLKSIAELKKYVGTWEMVGECDNWIIFKNWTVYNIVDPNGGFQTTWDDEYFLDREDGHLKVCFPAAIVHYYIDESRNLIKERIFENNAENTLETFTKISESIKLPDGIKDPQIGMTAKELKKSTWGTPKKINKTTTKYKVKEQWVYDGYKYIYLDNGIVTTIQE